MAVILGWSLWACKPAGRFVPSRAFQACQGREIPNENHLPSAQSAQSAAGRWLQWLQWRRRENLAGVWRRCFCASGIRLLGEALSLRSPADRLSERSDDLDVVIVIVIVRLS